MRTPIEITSFEPGRVVYFLSFLPPASVDIVGRRVQDIHGVHFLLFRLYSADEPRYIIPLGFDFSSDPRFWRSAYYDDRFRALGLR